MPSAACCPADSQSPVQRNGRASLVFWGGVTLDNSAGGPWTGPELAAATADQPAAIIFTTGSRARPKGVSMPRQFRRSSRPIATSTASSPRDRPAGLSAVRAVQLHEGVTTSFPDMDPSHPARVDPTKIHRGRPGLERHSEFGSPAIWDRVSRYCESHGVGLPTVRRVLSAGAGEGRRGAVCRTEVHPTGGVSHTPYGAKPRRCGGVRSRPAKYSPAPLSRWERAWVEGRGSIRKKQEMQPFPLPIGPHPSLLRAPTGRLVGRGDSCVSGPASVSATIPGIRWKVVRIVDGPIDCSTKPKIGRQRDGELIAKAGRKRGSTSPVGNRTSWQKLPTAAAFWHRDGKIPAIWTFWPFLVLRPGAHRVQTSDGPCYPVCCEAIFNQHPEFRRSALVGIGPAGRQRLSSS